MNHEQRVKLWEAINAVVAASGGNTGNTSVARQKAVAEVEREIEAIEIRHEAPGKSPGDECSICRGRHGREVEHACE